MNWDKCKLGSCITTLKGYAFKSSTYQRDGIPVVRVSDFTDNSISDASLVYLSPYEAEKHIRYELSKGDIIIQTVRIVAT